jgi:putative tRNA adenosine deaminase-associated protein
MAAQRANTSGQERDQGKLASGYDDLEGFAIAVVREDGKWHCSPLSVIALGSLRAAEDELRALRSSGAVFGLLDVDDEFFVVVRPAPSGTRILLSDATAAVDYDIAADVLDALHIESPNIDPDELDEVEPWPEGDLGVLSDLGLPEPVLSVIVAETDLYPDEQIAMIAQRLGFSAELSAELDKLSR